MNSPRVTLIGCGAIGRALLTRARAIPQLRIIHVVVRATRIAATRAELDLLGIAAQVVDQVPADAQLVLECAGHGALLD